MIAKISEIFKSIQGEGKYAGVKQVFVRFYGCNMHCVWCDTPYAIGDTPGKFKEYSVAGLLKEVEVLSKGCHSISLTGGEPLVQKDFIKEFLIARKKIGVKTYLETNGMMPEALKEIIDGIDIVAMDIKLPSSAKCQSYWREHEEFLKIAKKRDVFIKAVVSSDTAKDDIVKATKLIAKIDREIIFILQPNFFEMKNGVLSKCFEFQDYSLKYLSNVRVIPQMHKFMKLR